MRDALKGKLKAVRAKLSSVMGGDEADEKAVILSCLLIDSMISDREAEARIIATLTAERDKLAEALKHARVALPSPSAKSGKFADIRDEIDAALASLNSGERS